MPADLHPAVSQFSAMHPHPLTGIRIVDPEQLFRQASAELLMQPGYVFGVGRLNLEVLAVGGGR